MPLSATISSMADATLTPPSCRALIFRNHGSLALHISARLSTYSKLQAAWTSRSQEAWKHRCLLKQKVPDLVFSYYLMRHRYSERLLIISASSISVSVLPIARDLLSQNAFRTCISAGVWRRRKASRFRGTIFVSTTFCKGPFGSSEADGGRMRSSQIHPSRLWLIDHAVSYSVHGCLQMLSIEHISLWSLQLSGVAGFLPPKKIPLSFLKTDAITLVTPPL